MTEKRFNIEDGYYQGKSRLLIYDEESSDDYYFCGDYDDFKSICEQFNDFDIENKNLKKENNELKNKLAKVEEILNNRLSDDFQPVWDDGKTELFVEEKVGYWRALEQLKKKLIKENIIKGDME